MPKIHLYLIKSPLNVMMHSSDSRNTVQGRPTYIKTTQEAVLIYGSTTLWKTCKFHPINAL